MSRSPTIKSCPICERPATPEQAPFCSRGCRDRDLLKWLGEGYAIPVRPTDEDESEGLDSGAGRPL